MPMIIAIVRVRSGSRSSFQFYACIILGLTLLACQAFGQEADVKMRFLEEAPIAWRELVERAQNVQGRWSTEITQTYLNMRTQEAGEYKRNQNGRLVRHSERTSRDDQGETFDERVYAVNPRYAFELRRDSPDKPWVPFEILDLSRAELPEYYVRRLEGAGDFTHAIKLGATRLDELSTDEHFQILGCTEVESEGNTFIELSFALNREYESEGADWPIRRGTLLLDPENFWCLRAYTIQIEVQEPQLAGSIHAEFKDFVLVDDSFSYPRHHAHKRRFTYDPELTSKHGWPSQNENTLVFDFDVSKPDQLPRNEEFTLSAFGFPEPSGLQWPDPPKTLPWLLAALAGTCVVAGVFYILKRRYLTNVAT